jgi:hypothetical protein
MSKGSALSRAVAYFREGNLDEVEVAFILVKKSVERRLAERDASVKSQDKVARTPRKTRRTKAQIAAVDNAAASQIEQSGGTPTQEMLTAHVDA